MHQPTSVFSFLIALLIAVVLTGCAATDTGQGEARQGGSVHDTPTVAIYIGTGGGITTTIAPTPTAAPAASSTAEASSTADQTTDVPVTLDPSSLTGVPTLGE